jgi:enoyl-CoA hydratase
LSRIGWQHGFRAAPGFNLYSKNSVRRLELGRSIIRNPPLMVTRDGAVVSITLNNPDSGNRVDAVMAAELRGLCAELAADDGIRVVILTGSGAVFSTGRNEADDLGAIMEMQAARSIAALPVPVLAALNGDAADHGLELALAADLRLAAPRTRFWFSPPSAVSFPFDGGTQRLPRLVGPGWARDMLLTGRQLTADEALGIGLVNRVAAPGEDLLQMTRQLAAQMVEGSPLGVRYAKEAIMSGADLTLHHALGLEADLNVILQSTTDRAEGISSFLERRPPAFAGE